MRCGRGNEVVTAWWAGVVVGRRGERWVRSGH